MTLLNPTSFVGRVSPALLSLPPLSPLATLALALLLAGPLSKPLTAQAKTGSQNAAAKSPNGLIDAETWFRCIEEGVFDVPPEGGEAFMKIRRYFEAAIAERRQRPGDDLLSTLMALDAEKSLSDDELLAFCNLMITAGNETTTKLLGNALYWLWRNPEQRALVAQDNALIPQWVEETLRFDNSTQALMRTTLEDVEIGGVVIPANEYVLLLVGSANRDPDVFENADDFDIRRDTSAMLSFGKGTHFCMGASLARLEGRVAFEEWWKRFPDYEIQPEGCERVHSVNVRGFAALPVKV